MGFDGVASALTDDAVVLSPDFNGTHLNRDIQSRISFLLMYKECGFELTRDSNCLDGGRNPRVENFTLWPEARRMTPYIFMHPGTDGICLL